MAEEHQDELARTRQELQRVEAELKWLLHHQEKLDWRLGRVEDSVIFRFLRAVGGFALRRTSRVGRSLLSSANYQRWLRGKQAASASLDWHVERAAAWAYQPLITVLVTARDANVESLAAAVGSVRAQTYSNWELCLPSGHAATEAALASLGNEPRIRPSESASAGTARGDYVAFLGASDTLSPLALHFVVEALQQQPFDLLYTDEDSIDKQGKPVLPLFKPDWSPDLLAGDSYPGRLLVVSRRRLEEAGGLREEYGAAADYDLFLRAVEKPALVRHIPEILYHRRQDIGGREPALRAALEDAIRRRGWTAEVAAGEDAGGLAVRRRPRSRAPASVIICSRSPGLLGACLTALKRSTSYPDLQVIVVHHENGRDDQKMRRIIDDQAAVRVPFSGRYNFSEMNNLGVRAAGHKLLVFMNDDVEPLTPEWLDAMVAQLERPRVGVVGARLLYPDGTIQHAGIALGLLGCVGHPGRGVRASAWWPWSGYTRNVSAVTGACMGVRREVFEELGGFDRSFDVNYNDVDFCLRARRAGYEVIFEQDALLRHAECQSRRPTTRYDEFHRFCLRWPEALTPPDPYYSPSLRADLEVPSLRFE